MTTEMHTSVITILTGAGFSVPAGLPTAKKLGEALLSTKERDYFIHSDLVLYQNMSGEDYCNIDPLDDTFSKLLSFMKAYAISISSVFNYEDFYDLIQNLQDQMPISIMKKVLGQNSSNVAYVELLKQYMLRAFQQLVKYQLMSYDERFDRYGGFVELLNSLSSTCSINIHTLNHDTFMERLLSKSGLAFSDGFSDDSPYFYQPAGSEDKCKVQVFKDAYLEGAISLHKLHGSINYFKSYIATGETLSGLSQHRAVDVFKCSGTMGGDMYIKTDSGYKSCFALDPLFLSGTKTKIEKYGGLYISRQMQHFQEDISNSDILLVIGYGFADSKINEFIHKSLRQETRVVVISKGLTKEDVLKKLGHPTDLNIIVHKDLGVEDISPSILQ